MSAINAVLAANTMSLGFKQQLDSVWQNNLPLIRDRLTLLDAFAAVLATRGTASPQQRNEAIAIARKFTGSLGMFGYPTGSQLARGLEQLLLSSPYPDPESVSDIVRAMHTSLNL
ncbi:Hpt domain-containing protein [Granulicella paludicola]|uniref:Hpt domain-containing protein n=1 Tax=Granulicella paludicola TaxID=474951 RepID=UPI0021DFA00E|nr:Hpt domain-containing protein [Granulicella paludicola]